MQKIEHIGIAVKNLADSVPLFEKLLNSQCYKTEQVETEKVNTAFFKREKPRLNYWKVPIRTESLPGLLKKREKGFIILLLKWPI